MGPTANNDVIFNLNFACKTYDAVNKAIVSTKNRLSHLNRDEDIENNDTVKLLESIKGKLSRQILRELEFWPIYTNWMKDLPGIGPFIAGNLVLLYYYRFIPICKKCGTDVVKKAVYSEDQKEIIKKRETIDLNDLNHDEDELGSVKNTFYCPTCKKSVKGDGVLSYRIDKSKDFPNVSKWWAYMGRGIIDGKMPKRVKNVASNWSAKGRNISYQIGESFNKMKDEHLYKAFLLGEKAKIEQNRSEITKFHRHKIAKMCTDKLFLSHFWHIARELEGKSTRGIYADVILGHTGIIPPYYYGE